MDHHIVEDTAGNFDVIDGRRLRIAGADADEMRLTDLTGFDHIVDSTMVVVETTAETDLQLDTSILSCLDGLVYTIEIIVDWLLAEDVLASLCRLNDEFCMRVRGRSDDDGFNLRVIQDIICFLRHVFNAELLDIGSRLLVHERISNRLDRELRDEQRNIADVNFTDTTSTNDTNFHDKSSLSSLDSV